MHFSSFEPTSNIHTAPIYVTLRGSAGIETSSNATDAARTWLARLEDLETVLQEDNATYLGARLEIPNFDAVPEATLRSNREALLAEVQVAKEYFRSRIR